MRSTGRSANFNVTALAIGSRIILDGDRSVSADLPGLITTVQSRFDAGPVLLVTKDFSGFVDGQSLRIRDDQQTTLNFEFDTNNRLNDPNAVRVVIATGDNKARIALRIADAVNAAPFRVTATALDDRVYLTNDHDVNLDSTITALSETSQGVIISSAIDVRPFLLDFPGGNSDPGHRQIPEEVGRSVEQHVNQDFADKARDATPGVTTIMYNFRDDLGGGFLNVITEQQRIRAREAFQLWGNYLGVQFLESASDGLTIATGDLNILNPARSNVLDFPTNNFRVQVDPDFGDASLVMDSTVQWSDDYGEDWFVNSMVGIGSMLGLELANDLPVTNLMARFTTSFRFPNVPDPEPYFPGNADIVHGQHLYRPDGLDIDLYRFSIDLEAGREGLFTAETFAQRLPNASLLDTVISLYRENPDGTREIMARNDDYYSRDSFIEARLSAGVYYIGVSAHGNVDFDPTIGDSGIGGTSQGLYDLRLNFRSQIEAEDTLRDRDGDKTALDGDSDGIPGGVYNFWFQTQPLDRILEIAGGGGSFQDGQTLTLTSYRGVRETFEFNAVDGPRPGVAPGNVAINFQSGVGALPASTASQIATELAGKLSGVFGDDTTAANDDFATASGNLVIFRSSQFGRERNISLSPGVTGIVVHGRTIFVDKTAGPNSDGSLSQPFSRIAGTGSNNAFGSAQPNDIVRIVGNGGLDGNYDTLQDNLAYEFGFGTLPGQILSDGAEMAVPRGVTVMIDPGAVFKLRRSWAGAAVPPRR